MYTKDDNNIFLKIFPHKFEEFTIESGIIYKVTADNKIKIYPVGKIVEYIYTVSKTDSTLDDLDKLSSFGNVNDADYINSDEEREDLETDIENAHEELDEIKQFHQTFLTCNVGYCKFCSTKTYNLETITFNRICDDCYIKNSDLEQDIQNSLAYARDEKQQNVEKHRKKQLKTKGGGKNGVRN